MPGYARPTANYAQSVSFVPSGELLSSDVQAAIVEVAQKAGGATGGGTNRVFYNNDQTVTTDYSIPSGKNAISAGPVTINTGISVTIPTGSVWVIA